MSSQSVEKILPDRNAKSKEGSEEGKIYEILSLSLLAKRGYELSKKDDSKFCCFAIGREVNIGKEGKFDDVVFSYTNRDNTSSLIFVQIKHKKDYYQIDSEVLSAEASKAKGGGGGGMRRDFNLQKYFISFLDIREELKNPVSTKLRNGKIKNAVIFTNSGLNIEELSRNGFCLKKAPDDIINLFALKEAQESKIQELTNCYQLDDVSEDLRKIFKRSSDLHRLATELAQYVVWENYREKNILGIDESPIKHYHVALEREVVKKTEEDKKKSDVKKNGKAKQYCEAHFRDDFLDNDKSGSKLGLLDALFEAVRELDGSKKAASDDELKKVLKEVKLKVVPNFGKSKHNIQTALPSQWLTVNDEDITDFLECLVFIVNQPRVKELESLFIQLNQESAIESASLRQILDQIKNTGPKFRKRIEKVLGIEKKTKYKEKWISGENIVNFIEEQNQLIYISFIVTAMTLMYENDLIRYGKFNQTGELEERLDTFLLSNNKILCVNTSVTLLSSIKILQFLNTKKTNRAEDGRISVCMDNLNCKENRDRVSKAFQLESNNLLIIECRHYDKEQDLEELCNVAHDNPSKKIIFIIQQDESTILPEKYRTDYENEGQYIILAKDVIDLKYFEPEEDPFKKEMIIFQGHEKKVSLATLSGISCWREFLSQARIQEGQDIIDPMTLVEIFSSDEIEVGSKPLETNNLEGAYAIVFEEINPNSLVNKLISQEPVIKTDEIIVISGISEWNKAEKVNKLIQYLGLVNEQKKIKNQLGDIGSDSRIQIADDQFKDEDFKRICFDYPKKMIFWIFIKHENSRIKFILQQFYNPEFYIKRKFKNVVISKCVKEQLMTDHLYEIFIFYSVNNQQEFTDLFQFENEYQKAKIENNCKNGKIMLFNLEDKARSKFQKVWEQNRMVHLLRIEQKQFIWCNSHVYPGAKNNLMDYIDREQSEISVVEEDNLITEIKDKKIVIIADDPGMGKTTTLTKFHESKNHTASFTETHWILRVNLKDHLEAVRDVELKYEYFDVLNVVNFLSKVDLKLNHKLAKNLLRVSLLDQNNKNTKPLLLAFDGFDEVLDDVDREKILSLLKFLKNKTSAKIWITTRLHYKEILEFNFSCFAIQFDPLDDDSKVAYIKKYLKDRMCLILSEKKFAEVFVQNDEMQENESIKIYISEFLNKIKSVFKSDTYKFIGTPLQLYLMLEGSISHFRYWVEQSQDQIPNFDYLGTDVGEVYKNFLNRKYDVYFKKMGIRKGVRQKQDKFMFNQYNKVFAKSLVLKSQSKKPLEKFKQVVLSAGIIKSNGTNIEFIHTTFRDYFSAKVFVQWIKKVPNELLNLSKHKFLLQDIFKKPDYQQTRFFIDLKLKKVAETESFKESVKHYGVIVGKLLIEEENSLMDDNGTALGWAVEEGNKNIVRFFLNSLKEHKDVLKKFLFHRTATGKSALDLVFVKHDIEVMRILLDAASEISDDTLQELLYFSDTIDGHNILDTAALWCKNFEIFKELVNRSQNLLDLIKNENKKYSSLNVAVRYNNQEFVRFLIQEFQHDAKSLKQLLLFQDFDGNNALGLTVYLDISVAEKLICIAKTIKDNNETLKKTLLPEKYVPLMQAVCMRKVHFVEMLINVAKDIDDDKYTLEQMILKDLTSVSVLHIAAVGGNGDIIKLLLETAASLGKDALEKLVFAVNADGKNAIHLMVDNFHEDIFVDSFKIPEEDSYRNIREKVMEIFNSISEEKMLRMYKHNLIFSIKYDMINDIKSTLGSATNFKINRNEKLKNLLLAVDSEESRLNTLQIACVNGNLKIIKELISYAININDGGTTLKQLLTSTSIVNETPFEMLRFGYNSEIKQIIESLILESRSNNKEHAANILQEINDEYAEINSTSLEYSLLPCNDSAYSGRLLVFTFKEACERLTAQERSTFKFFG